MRRRARVLLTHYNEGDQLRLGAELQGKQNKKNLLRGQIAFTFSILPSYKVSSPVKKDPRLLAEETCSDE
jgi:hypothetical protein